MKLHLPVRLFRAVLSLMLAVPSAMYASYSYPSSIDTPYYSTDYIYSSYEIDDYCGYSSDYNILLENDILADSYYAPMMDSYTGSRYIASSGTSRLRNLSLSGSSQWFRMGDDKDLTFAALDVLSFYSNGSSYSDAVIYGVGSNDITFEQNAKVLFQNNSSDDGGAIYVQGSYSTLNLKNNSSVEFSGNYSSDDGGAIYASSATVDVSQNDEVLFKNNTSNWWGGAICGSSSSILLQNNGELEFSGNKARVSGGAIWASSSTLNISGNSSVLFEKNAVGSDGSYSLQSIYTGGSLNLSAPSSGEIRFHDTISVGGDLYLNNTYTDEYGYTQYAEGKIIFDGQYAESHLAELNGSTPSTDAVITSQTSTVGGSTHLHGGTLLLKGGARLNSSWFNAYSGSTLSVGSGSRMSVTSLYMYDGSTLNITLSSGYNDNPFSVYGDLSVEGSLTITFTDTSWLSGENDKLLYVSGGVYNWDSGNVSVSGAVDGQLSWLDGYLVWNGTVDDLPGDEPGDLPGEIIYTSQQTGYINISNYASVTFRDQTSSAIYTSDAVNIHDNGIVLFQDNKETVSTTSYYSSSNGYGAAIYSTGASDITISDNVSVSFINNSVSSSAASDSSYGYGGAIYASSGSIKLCDNGSVEFSGNKVSAVSSETTSYTAKAHGGALWGNSSIKLDDNASVSFIKNSVYAAKHGDTYARGGAVYANSSISLNANDSVEFTGNSAISGYNSDEAYASGGAVHGSGDICLSNNRSVTFSDNKVTVIPGAESSTIAAKGGAIYASGNLSITGNGTVLFQKNAEIENGSYRLRSIYADGSGKTVSLSAAAGMSIEFRDSVYIAGGTTVNFNESESDEYGEMLRHEGDICFTGAYVESDLYDVKEGVFGTQEEIDNSRTSQVLALTQLYGGRLRVEDGAIYSGYGISAASGSDSTVRVKDATLDHAGYDMTFDEGTTLELAGTNTLKGELLMQGGSRLSFDNNVKLDATFVHGNVSFSDSLTLSLSGAENCENNILMYVLGDISGWDDAELTMATSGYSLSDVTWVRNCLVLNYNAATFAPYVRGDISYVGKEGESNRITEPLSLYFYNNVLFDYLPVKDDYTGNPYGGAVSSEGNISIRLNGIVTFSNNTVTHDLATRGGAIYGTNIKLCDNGELIIRSNRVISQVKGTYNANAARGGAIYGVGCVSGNSSVLFSQNDVIAENNAYGGAIYVGEIISANGDTVAGSFELTGNENLEFSRNTVACASSSYGGAIYVGTNRALTISDNGHVLFSMNSSATSSAVEDAETLGGAISVSNGRLEISGNDSVVFEKNAEKISGNDTSISNPNAENKNTQYRLRGLYVNGASSEVSLSAGVGQSITFRDSIYIGSIDEFSLNTGGAGGDIIFTGATTVADLKEMKSGEDGTAVEIEDSRTSEVSTMTNLYGGRLIMEDSAVYRCAGITAWGESTVLLRNASLARTTNQMNSQFTFHRGTTLSLVGANKIAAEALTMMDQSSWEFNLSSENRDNPMLSYSGLLYVKGTLYININRTEDLSKGEYKLMQVSQSIGNWWNERDVIVNDGALTLNDLQWVDNSLYFLYTGQSIPETSGGTVTPDSPVNPGSLAAFTPSGNILSANQVNQNNEVRLSGTGSFTLDGKVNAGAFTVNIGKNLTFKSNKKNPGSLFGDGDLTKSGAGTLTMNDGNSSWTGDTYLNAGTIKVKGSSSLGKGDVFVKGGILNLGSKVVANDIVQSAPATIKSGKKFTGTYTLEKGELQKGSTLNIQSTATLASGVINGTLSGKGKTEVTGSVRMGDKAKITTSALTVGATASLTTSTKGLNSKSTAVSIGDDASLLLGGKLSASSLGINGGELKTSAVKPAAMAVKGDISLTDAVLTTNGKVTANTLSLTGSDMTIQGTKAQNLTVKQYVTVGSGSCLSLNGKLSAGSLTVNNGGTLILSGSKPQTLKVKGTFSINRGSSIILDYDFVAGKTYKVVTFGATSGDGWANADLYSIFGVSEDSCTFLNTGKALTLTVNTTWNPINATSVADEPSVAALTEDDGVAVAAETTVEGTPVITMEETDNQPVADALVQANWGQLEASRAFVHAMANRSMAVQLGNGERAVWASAIGASSRHSSAGGHAGADTNVSGGAFGLETQVGRASLFGMALGNSWTRVSPHGFGTIEQDTTHLGLYGQTNWRSGVTADWSAAYGRSDSETMGSDWSQKHLQLDGRVSYNHELNANTVLSPFAGLQYYASDSATVDGTNIGSLQNLRAEIGVAASRSIGKFGVFGEIAVHQDIARNNPVVDMNGSRCTGMNPGRTGLNFTVGASYELSDKWSVNASYTGEFVENANAHSANVGATDKF